MDSKFRGRQATREGELRPTEPLSVSGRLSRAEQVPREESTAAN